MSNSDDTVGRPQRATSMLDVMSPMVSPASLSYLRSSASSGAWENLLAYSRQVPAGKLEEELRRLAGFWGAS